MTEKAGSKTAAKPNASVIASSIHALRRRQGLTLAQLAEATALDKGYLSRVERGQKSPSVATLLRIAEALNVQVGHLFGETTTEDSITVVRKGEHIGISSASEVEARLQAILPASDRRRISVFIIEPGTERNSRGADHPGDEMIYVLEGAVEVKFPDRTIELDTGDCLHFDGHLRHQLREIGKGRARALVVVAEDLLRQDAG